MTDEESDNALRQLLDAIIGTVDRPGMAEAVRHGEKRTSKLEAQHEDHERRLGSMEREPGAKASDRWEKVGFLALGAAVSALVSILSNALGQAKPQQPAPIHGAPQPQAGAQR